MALIEREYFVDRCFGTLLEGDHLARPRTHFLVIGRVLQLAVPLVAGTLP